MAQRSTTAEFLDSPVYWFTILELARQKGHFLKAQQALEELRRLGMVIQFVRPCSAKGKGGPTHAA